MPLRSPVRGYDDLSTHYAEKFGGLAADTWKAGILRVIGSDVIRGARVLDLACGTGVGGEALRKLKPAALVGLDGSREMLAQAAEKYDRLIFADLRRPPTKIGEFDVAVSGFDSLNHLHPDDLYGILRHIKTAWRISNLAFDIVLESALPDLLCNSTNDRSIRVLDVCSDYTVVESTVIMPPRNVTLVHYLPKVHLIHDIIEDSGWSSLCRLAIEAGDGLRGCSHYAFSLVSTHP
jgi:SAM-dependent methyltransferase